MTLESIVDGQQPNESFYEGISQEKDYSARIRIVEVLLFSFLLYSGTRECHHPLCARVEISGRKTVYYFTVFHCIYTFKLVVLLLVLEMIIHCIMFKVSPRWLENPVSETSGSFSSNRRTIIINHTRKPAMFPFFFYSFFALLTIKASFLLQSANVSTSINISTKFG